MKKKFKLGFIFITLLSFTLTMIFGLTNPARNTYAAWSGSGAGTSADPYQIGTLDELNKFRDIVNGLNEETKNNSACAKLTADIDLEGSNTNQWIPISDFRGTFDGDGHEISGLYISMSVGSGTEKFQNGLFGSVTGSANIKNLTVKGSITANINSSTNGNGVSGIVALVEYNVYDGTVVIENCTSEVTISGTARTSCGGIVGYAKKNVNIINCVNKGNITDKGTNGGILGSIGSCTIEIINCHNEGTITGNTAGGIASSLTGTITKSYNTGNITGYYSIGGILGDAYRNATVTNCYNTGVITGTSGENGDIGGIVGHLQDFDDTCNVLITNCYNYGAVSGIRSGSLVGKIARGEVTNSYALEGTHASLYGQEGITLTNSIFMDAAAFKLENSFVNWDFDEVWEMGTDYPTLLPYEQHSFTYTADGATITAVCSVDSCSIKNGLTLTLVAPESLSYTGHSKTIAFASGYSKAAFPKPTIVYYKDDQVVTECIEKGTYVAKVTFGTATAQLEFTITDHIHEGEVFEAWTSNNSLPTTEGNYYLTSDVNIDYTWEIISGTINLCLNGYGIKRTGGGCVIVIYNDATLNVYDCDDSIEHKYSVATAQSNGAGLATVDDSLTSDFEKFTGGYITGGLGAEGAALYIQGTFNMYGGTIIGNSCSSGDGNGAIQVNGGTFTMNGGSIIHNFGRSGGALFVETNSTFNMNGGLIAWNNTSVRAGAIFTRGTTKINGGEIKNNWGGEGTIANWGGTIEITGGYIHDNIIGSSACDVNNIWKIGGNPIIKDNKKTNDEIVGLLVNNGKKMTVSEPLTKGASIGIKMEATGGVGVFTTGWKDVMGYANPADYFVSDVNGLYFGLIDGEAALFNTPQVARVGDNTYSTLTAAYAACGENDVIVLFVNLDITSEGYNAYLTIEKNIEIDLNGKILKFNTGQIVLSGTACLTVDNSIIEKGGILGVIPPAENAYIVFKNARLNATKEDLATNTTFYTIASGFEIKNINTDGSHDDDGFIIIIGFKYEELKEDEDVDIKVPQDKEKADHNDILTVDTNANPITVEWFYDDDKDGNPDNPNDPIGTEKEYKVKKPKDTGHTIIAVIKQDEDEDGNPLSTPREVVTTGVTVTGEIGPYFQVGDATYSDFKEAFEACPTNGTITLIKDYDTTGLEYPYLTIDRNVLLDVNGHKLYGSWIITIGTTTTLSIFNSKPETGGVAGGLSYNYGYLKLYNIRINLSADELNIYMKDEWVVAEGYEAVFIKQDQTADDDGYLSIVRPKGRVIYENDKPYNFENETWFKGSQYDNIINIQGDYTFFGSDYFYNTESYGFSFVDSNQNYNNIFIKSKEFAEAPTSFYIAGGSGTQADPYIVAILTEFEELDTTTKPEIIIPGGKEVADDGDILTVDITGTDITIEWFYDENGDGKPDSTTPVGTGAGYTVRFVDLKDDTHNDQGKTLVAVVTQKYDENGCELPKPLTIISKTAKVTNVFPKTKKLAVGTVYLIDEYIDVEADANMKLGNVGDFPDIKVLAGLYKVAHVAGANNTLTQIAFGNMFKIYTGASAGLDLPINGDEYMAPGNKVIGIRLVSGTGVAGDPYVFEVVYNTTYIALDPTEDIDIDTPNTPPRAKDGDEISIYTNSNPVIIEWYYDDDNDGDPDDPEHPIAIGPTYTVMCPDKNNPNHDDTGHTIIGVIKQDKDENGNPLDNPIEVTTNPIKVTGKEKPIEQGRVYYFNEFFDIETPIYVSGINEEIVPGQYKVSKPEGSDNGYDFKDLFKDASDNNLTLSLPKDTRHTLDDIIGIKCISGTGVATDPYVFEVFYNDSYKPLDPDDTINIIIPDDKKKAEDGDELEIDTEATDITIKWYYDDNGDGNPDDPDTPIGTGKKYTISEPKDTGHKIIAVVTQEKKQDGTDYEDGEKPTVTSLPARVNGSYTPLDENSHPGVISTDPAFDKGTLEVDCDADDITVKWYYADEDGNPTGQPIGEGKTYTVKAPDTTTGQDDTGHKIVAVITQEKDEDGNDYPEGQKPQATTLTVQIYKPINPDEEIGVKTTDDKERPGNGDTIEVETKFTPVEVKWYYDDNNDGQPDDQANPIGTGNTYTITEPNDTGHTIIGVVTQNKKPDRTDYSDDEEIPTIITDPIKVHGYLPDEYVHLDPNEEPAPTVPNKPKLENGDEITIETDATDVIVKWYYTDEEGHPTGEPIGEGKTYTLKCPDANDPTHDDRDHNIIAVITQKYDENGDEYAAGEAPTQYSKPVTNIIPSHTHNFSYTAVGATITAKCTTPGCDITEGLKLTLLVPTGSMVCDDKPRVATIQTGYSTLVFGKPVIKYYKGDTEVTQCIDAGTYTAKVTIGNATAQISFTIEAWKPKTDATTSKDVPASEAQNIKVEVEGAGKNDDISVKVEVKTTLTAQETGKDFDKIQTKLESGEKITRVYEVKLIRTTNGVEEVIQPSDIKPGTKITVTMTLPEEVLNAESFKILHIHSATDTEFITDYVKNGNTVSFSVSRLSEFAFIIKGKGLAGWAIALIVIDSLLVAMAMAYLAIFFIFNKWIVINGKAIRALVCGKKEDKTRVVTLFLGIEYRNANEIFNSQEEALGKIE